MIRSSRPIRFWLALLALSAALPLLALLVWSFVAQVRREQAEARAAALRMATDTATSLRNLQVESLALLERMAQRPDIRAADPARCDSLFAIVDFFPQYANLVLFDAKGRILCSAEPSPRDREISTAALRWVSTAIADGSIPLGQPMLRTLGNQWVSVLATRIGAPEAPRAILALVQLPPIHGPAEPGGTITVVDAEGRLLGRMGGGPWRGSSVRGAEVTEIVLAQKEGRTEAIGVDGVSRQYGFTHLPELGWYVYVGIPSADLMQPVRSMFVRGTLVGTAVILTALGFAIVLSRSISRPIAALSAAAREVASAGFTRGVPVTGPEEVAALGEAFNEMVERRARAEARLVESQRNLKALSDRLMTVQEEERMRIAREIHDDLGQTLTALKMDVGGLLAASERSDPARTAALRDRIARTIDRTVEAVQRISGELRPGTLDDLGLVATLESEAQVFEERTGIECDLSLDAAEHVFDKSSETAVYRIIQEAMTNVARHSNASRMEIRLRARPDEVLLEIRDDGRGIRPAEIHGRTSLGLIGIRERAAALGGTVHVEGIEGRGTILTVRLPPSTRPEVLTR